MSLLLRYIRATVMGFDEEAEMIRSLNEADRELLARMRACNHL